MYKCTCHAQGVKFAGVNRGVAADVASLADGCSYCVIWSPEDEEYVGLCAEFPSLSWVATSQDEALKGIRVVVVDVLADMKKAGETAPNALPPSGALPSGLAPSGKGSFHA